VTLSPVRTPYPELEVGGVQPNERNRYKMFGSVWSWLVPIVGAAVVFAAVLLTTPPGFRAISDIVFGTPRGPSADAAAYALGAAGSLALLTLLVFGLVLGVVDLAVQRWR
jgi:hypothetical protein